MARRWRSACTWSWARWSEGRLLRSRPWPRRPWRTRRRVRSQTVSWRCFFEESTLAIDLIPFTCFSLASVIVTIMHSLNLSRGQDWLRQRCTRNLELVGKLATSIVSMKTNAKKSHKRVKLRQKFASKDAGKLKVRLDMNIYLNGKTVHHAITRNVSKCNSTFYRELDKSLSVTKEKKEKYVGE